VRQYHTVEVVVTTVQILYLILLHLLAVEVVGLKPSHSPEKTVVLGVEEQDQTVLEVLVTHLLLHRHRVTTAVAVQKPLITPPVVEAALVQ
jgi:hypothetical protein